MSGTPATILQGLAEYVSPGALQGYLSDASYRLQTMDSATFLQFGVVLVLVLAFTVNRIRAR
ncbi:MAG TPA: hypothetical protein VHG51_18610 [Longimicrobiaceae bacterium]|nr:hypothetical protein [Longimicrobiaceae bacterium]